MIYADVLSPVFSGLYLYLSTETVLGQVTKGFSVFNSIDSFIYLFSKLSSGTVWLIIVSLRPPWYLTHSGIFAYVWWMFIPWMYFSLLPSVGLCSGLVPVFMCFLFVSFCGCVLFFNSCLNLVFFLLFLVTLRLILILKGVPYQCVTLLLKWSCIIRKFSLILQIWALAKHST